MIVQMSTTLELLKKSVDDESRRLGIAISKVEATAEAAHRRIDSNKALIVEFDKKLDKIYLSGIGIGVIGVVGIITLILNAAGKL